jgi:hypothetical protein
MSLSPGVRLGSYEVLALIGAGGMGEVYRARDVRLGRDVAVKVLPAALARDPTRLQRFEQEARAAAALNHPGILAVFDIGQHGDAPYIVSELLEGATLREHLKGGAVLPRKAEEWTTQIAHGLAAAHDKGIVHRDLKPENIFITTDGRVKILDFGLAKLTQAESSAAAVGVLPTTPPDTLPGVVLGTAGYMAPEQVRGLSADHRADVFSLGVVLYEMLSGERAFRGETAIDAMTAILKEQPPPLALTERRIPAALGRIIDRCIEKNPAERFQSARDVAFAVAALSASSDDARPVAAVDARRTRMGSPGVAWSITALATAVAIVIGVVMYIRRAPPAADVPPLRIRLQPIANEIVVGVNPVALSPDGQRLAIPSGGLLWVRRLDEIEGRPLPGTEGAAAPFWSADGQWIGFFSEGKLKKILASGGMTTQICNVQGAPGGGAWNEDDIILFGGVGGPAGTVTVPIRLQRVSASGGTPEPVTTLDAAAGETWHIWPAFLPDRRRFLYFATGPKDPKGIYVGSLDSNERQLVVQGGSNATFASGHLFYLRGTTLVAQPFNPDRLELTGDAVPVAAQVRVGGSSGATGVFSVSPRGVLMYQTGANVPRLAWFDRSGQPAVIGEPGAYHNLSLAPGGRRAAVGLAAEEIDSRDIWLVDTTDGARTRFSFDAADENAAIWSNDGQRIVFNSNRKGRFDLYERASNLAGADQLLFADDLDKFPLSWSPDGRHLLFQAASRSDNRADVHLWVLPMVGERKSFRLLQSSNSIEAHGQFSPDGRWVAYASEPVSQPGSRAIGQNPTPQVFVAEFPGATGQRQVSIAGGTHPRWRADGKEIFYLGLDARVMAAPVSVRDGALEFGQARPFFALQFPPLPGPASGRISRQPLYSYAPSADGQRFLVRTILQETAPITLVVNWQALLKRTIDSR